MHDDSKARPDRGMTPDHGSAVPGHTGAAPDTTLRRALPGYRWEGVELLRYKQEGSAPFRDVTRQVLFADAGGAEWRYFEVAPGGWSTLERHQHTHAVMILRGRGSCLVGERVRPVAEHDLVEVPPETWHQFRAAADAPLGFLCLVSRERDRPRLPGPEDLAALRALPEVARFLDGEDAAPEAATRPRGARGTGDAGTGA